MERGKHAYRSLFWPVLLIGVGLIWLLDNLGIFEFSAANVAMLLRLWPVLLIILGFDLLLARRFPTLGALVGAGAALLVLGLVVTGPELGLAGAGRSEVRHDHFSAALDDAVKAEVKLELPVGSTTIESLIDSNELIDATLAHRQQAALRVSGEREKMVRLETGGRFSNTDLFGWAEQIDELHSEIGLSPRIPLELTVDASVGETQLDLRELSLTGLTVAGDVGRVALTLPATGEPYPVRLTGGVGAFEVELPEAADIDMQINGDIGHFTIDLPPEVGVEVQARIDVGGIDLPHGYLRSGSNDRQGPGQSGTWRSPNFERADYQVRIVFKGDIGGLTVK